MIGRQILMRGWKTAGSPSLQDWFVEIGRVAAYEEMSYRRIDRMDKYTRKWGSYIMYIATRTWYCTWVWRNTVYTGYNVDIPRDCLALLFLLLFIIFMLNILLYY